MNQAIEDFIFETFTNCFLYMRDPLDNYKEFSEMLSKKIKTKLAGNEQFNFDVELDNMIREGLIKHSITGRIFSEESEYYDMGGDKKYRVVYDPFCNSSLASRTFQEGAVGISIFNYDYSFITSAVMDYQTGILGLVEDNQAKFYQLPGKDEMSISGPLVSSLKDAWIIMTLENPAERSHIDEGMEIYKIAKRVNSSSGHIYWLKLAAGFIDGYLDPFGGEELYEMFAASLAQHAGCIVTDTNGKTFDPAEYLKIFDEDRHYLFKPVAARTEKLHKQILEKL
jgi:fructose-1,6-bisphosphatase/inositol monophosphatase family enzyme